MTIDWHAHWLPPAAVAWLSARNEPPLIRAEGEQLIFVTGSGSMPTQNLRLARTFTDIEAHLAHMDAAGVAHRVLSWPTTFGLDGSLDAASQREFYTLYNDGVAALLERYPRRFSSLAALASADIAWSARELERAHRTAGVIGGTLPVGGFLSREGADRFRPIFEVAQRHASHIYLHTGEAAAEIPGQIGLKRATDAASARWLLGASADFASSIITLAFGDFLDPYPDVTIQIAMLGGALGTVIEALESRADRLGDPSPRAALKRVYVDSGVIGEGRAVLALAFDIFGAERILFGSDYPLIDTARTIATIENSGFPPEARQRILRENGLKVLARHGIDIPATPDRRHEPA